MKAAEHALHKKCIRTKTASHFTVTVYLTWPSLRAKITQTHISFLSRTIISEVHFMFSFTVLNWDGEIGISIVGFHIQYLYEK
jgi:hypothetical protein